jgi:hypothetical protein
MDAIKISNDQMRRIKMMKARDHIDKVQEIVSSEVKTQSQKQKLNDAMNLVNTEKTGVQMIFNYILTLFIFGWLFLIIAGILATPGIRILYELGNANFQHLRILLIFSIYTYFQVMNPYAAFLQIIYISTIYMFFESIDFWSLITFNFKNFSMNLSTPLFWDEGLLGLLYRGNIDPGFLTEIGDISNIDMILGNLNKLMLNITEVEKYLQSEQVANLFTPELGYTNGPNLNRGDILNSLLDTGNYLISQEQTPGLMKILRPYNMGRKLQFQGDDVNRFNILPNPEINTSGLTPEIIAERLQEEAQQQNKMIKLMESMGLNRNPTTRSAILFYSISFLIIVILITSIVFTYDKVGFKMVLNKNKTKK